MQLSDSLDFGKRQELAATVNNQYKYQRDAEEERHIIEVGQRNRNMMWATIVLAICTVLGGAVYYQRRRNKYLEEVLNLSNELTDTKAERDKMKGNLQNINAEIDRYRDEIKNKEQLLAEKLEENKRFITLLHKAELEERAEDVVTAIKQASEGKHRMSSSDWQRFYHAVDELQPDLMERIAQHLGKFTEQQQQVCYLLSIGLTNTQIENLTDIPHVTVWRWVKKFDWVQGEKG
jgi:signal transduction protein with GAF and PtsI domain